MFISAEQNILKPSGIQEQTPAARTLDDFLNETARVLGQPGIAKLTGDEKRRALLDVLRTVRALLIYDNLETLSKEEQEAMADFLRELPQACKAIITSRRRGGEGAVWLRVEKLDWDAARGIIENEMARDAGLANKLRLVPESRWQELYDETNGSPLALVHTLGLMRVRTALTFDGALAMLRGAGRNDDLVKFVYQEARKELTENDKTALGALSFFVPSATFEVWSEVANLSRNALETTIDRLSALSLVDVLAGEERYALHPLTRAFVRDELLADANVARETGMRFAQYWTDYLRRYTASSSENEVVLLYQKEESNLDMVAMWLDQQAELIKKIALAKASATSVAQARVKQFKTSGFNKDSHHLSEYENALVEAIAITREETEVLKEETSAHQKRVIFKERLGEMLLLANGELAMKLGQWEKACEHFERFLSETQESDRWELIGYAKYNLARAWEMEERTDLALPLAQDALKIYERLQHGNLAEVRELVERLQKAVSSGQ